MDFQTLDKVLHLIRPGANRSISIDESRNWTLIWQDKSQTQPTDDELAAGLVEVQKLAYRENRAVAYPSFGDQLDALWKGGQAATDMLAQIQAVKTQFPKPS